MSFYMGVVSSVALAKKLMICNLVGWSIPVKNYDEIPEWIWKNFCFRSYEGERVSVWDV